jgi:hypothetical protein
MTSWHNLPKACLFNTIDNEDVKQWLKEKRNPRNVAVFPLHSIRCRQFDPRVSVRVARTCRVETMVCCCEIQLAGRHS